MDTKKFIIISVILCVLIVAGAWGYTFMKNRKSAPVSTNAVVATVQSTPKPTSTPITINQDVKNTALKGLASAKSENTLTISVFVDVNGNGKKDPEEVNYDKDVEVAYGIPGKTSNAHTGSSGQVVFNNVDAGNFEVYMFNTPKDYTSTTPLIIKDVKIPPSANVNFGIKPTTQK